MTAYIKAKMNDYVLSYSVVDFKIKYWICVELLNLSALSWSSSWDEIQSNR